MPGNMPAGRLNPTIGFGGEARRSLCVVRFRDAAIYRRLESVPVDEVGVLIQQLTSPQKKHTPDPTAHKRLKETHDPCDSFQPGLKAGLEKPYLFVCETYSYLCSSV